MKSQKETKFNVIHCTSIFHLCLCFLLCVINFFHFLLFKKKGIEKTTNFVHCTFRKRNETKSKLIELQILYKKKMLPKDWHYIDQLANLRNHYVLVCLYIIHPQIDRLLFAFFLVVISFFYSRSLYFYQKENHIFFVCLHQSSCSFPSSSFFYSISQA